MKSSPLPIIRDFREQAPFAFSGLPVEVEVGALEAGDYSVRGFERRVAVERKELQDLVGCLSGERDRFERELARLRGYDSAAVIVEEPMSALRQGRYRGHLNPNWLGSRCWRFPCATGFRSGSARIGPPPRPRPLISCDTLLGTDGESFRRWLLQGGQFQTTAASRSRKGHHDSPAKFPA